MGFEIIDCPFPEWKFQPSDFVASFGLHAALMIGERMKVKPELIARLVDELPRFQSANVKEWRVRGRRIRQKLCEARLVSGGTGRSHRAGSRTSR